MRRLTVAALFLVACSSRGCSVVPVGMFGPFVPSKIAISALSASSGCAGDSIAITGNNFNLVSGVDFNGTAASFSVQSSKRIVTQVPNGVTTGSVHVVQSTGTLSSPYAFTVNASCAFAFDMTNCANLPAGMTAARTGSDVYVPNGSTSSVVARTAASGWVCEDQGNGVTGVRTFAGFTNNAPGIAANGSTNFAAVGWSVVSGTINITASAAVDPSGTSNAAALQVPSGGNNPYAALKMTTAGTVTSDYGAAAVWVRDGSPAETAAGALSPRNDSGSSASLSTGNAWRRRVAVVRKSDIPGGAASNLVLWPTGASATDPQGFNTNVVPTFTTSATGGEYAWCAQAWDVADFSSQTPCLAGASSGAATLQAGATAVSNLLDASNNFHIEFGFLLDPYFVESTTVSDDTNPYTWSMQTAGGVWGTRYGGQTVMTVMANGASVGGANIGDTPEAQLNPAIEMETEVWSRPNAPYSDGGAKFKINGAWNAVNGQVAFSPVQVSSPSSFYLGSKLGTSNYFGRAYTYLRRDTADPNAADGVMLGDSLTAVYSFLSGVHGWIQTLAEARSHYGIVSYAYPGQTITQQTAKWDTAPQKGQAYVKWVAILLGANCMDPTVSSANGGSETDVQCRNDLQTQINDIHASNSTAKIIVYPVLPVNCHFSTLVQGYLDNYNHDIIGDGPNPITDPGGGVLVRGALWTQLAGGTTSSTYCYLSQYDSGDQEHENDAARQIIGSTGTQSYRATLLSLGFLP